MTDARNTTAKTDAVRDGRELMNGSVPLRYVDTQVGIALRFIKLGGGWTESGPSPIPVGPDNVQRTGEEAV